ncbi:bifunctional UDP-N-acetylglucosamine diphosphorylase/glucosamine-1-phosphate N-acetyltransferase GlmU [Marinagarivorans algicola]|uniref:bifunctional UDP-N-acetylglucosamine diphosphorylase/glucosamine-1-phosphate N-acetyltransferase GlmU n=1 Tax=Marinagarivorans algicola TaxID=1513270 RepID=UPI000AB195FF|nr:bifunctional UDP-N-acetylglucosamine diphosphorylase/glucosamine-1-phosphate N-acetyltransferase GlmU [Marinagarivorans algicola]
MLEVVILAAGKGSRMKSAVPKVMHSLAGKPFLQHVVDKARAMAPKTIHLVVGHGATIVNQHFNQKDIHSVVQAQQLGTGHAVAQTLEHLADSSVVLILYGDVPLIQQATLESLTALVSADSMGLLTVTLPNPTGYGRIVRNHGAVTSIVEQKDATDAQLAIGEVNTGVMAVNAAHLKQWLPQLTSNNAQGELYLTDIIAMASEQKVAIHTAQPAHTWEVLGVNNRQQQAELERIYQGELAKQLMEQGVTLLDPARFDCRGRLTCGDDCVIDINCVIEGDVVLGNGVEIGPNCVIKNTTIGDYTIIKANCILEDSTLHANCDIGPFARLRPGTELADKAKIGNFVETKNALIGKGSKVNHLSYVGDAQLGESVNVGAGTITCNYDGANKHQTLIGDNVFVGSNTALVAPVSVASGATIAAGSIITKPVNADELVIARAKQKAITGWQRPVKKPKA